MRLASETLWCGSGTHLSDTPCPGAGSLEQTALEIAVGYDQHADKHCRRHDHGSKAAAIAVGVKLGCDIDRDLAWGTSNWAVQGVFGDWGIAGAWGCADYGTYTCWNWASKWWGGYWRYGSYCSGHHTHYGPTRHQTWGNPSWYWGYEAKHKSCSGDLDFRAKNCPPGTSMSDGTCNG